MHPDALPFLRGPCCGRELSLAIVAAADRFYPGEVHEGTLACACGRRYPVSRGVPELLTELDAPTRENRDVWNFIWERMRGVDNYLTSEEMFKADFGPDDGVFRDAVVLEAGTGLGRYLPYLLDRGCRRLFGADVTDAVFESYERLAARAGPRLCLVRCDLQRLPFKKEALDVVVSARVLHHLPDMRTIFAELVERLRPGGLFVAVVYGRDERERVLGRVQRFKEALRRRLSLPQLYALAVVPAAAIYVVLHGVYPLAIRLPLVGERLPLRGVYSLWSRLDRISLWKFVVFDSLVSPRARFLSEPELAELLSGLGARDVRYEKQHEAMWTVRFSR